MILGIQSCLGLCEQHWLWGSVGPGFKSLLSHGVAYGFESVASFSGPQLSSSEKWGQPKVVRINYGNTDEAFGQVCPVQSRHQITSIG